MNVCIQSIGSTENDFVWFIKRLFDFIYIFLFLLSHDEHHNVRCYVRWESLNVSKNDGLWVNSEFGMHLFAYTYDERYRLQYTHTPQNMLFD